jgi:hypothetical protein
MAAPWFSGISVRECLGVMLVPAVMAFVTIVVWTTVAVNDRLWGHVRLMPLPLRRHR